MGSGLCPIRSSGEFPDSQSTCKGVEFLLGGDRFQVKPKPPKTLKSGKISLDPSKIRGDLTRSGRDLVEFENISTKSCKELIRSNEFLPDLVYLR